MKKIGLALGGGGARGVAHIAYIKAMEECGVYPSVISGTSSGAIVGALYAGGMKPDDIYGILENMFGKKKRAGDTLKKYKNMSALLVTSVSKKYLQRILPKQNFEDLDIPLKIVATNFHTLEERVFEKGDILEALMGSIAYPGVFAPQPVGDEYFIDGGATNIIPFDIIRSECDILIAIDVSMVRPNSFKPSIKNSAEATWAATHERLTRLKQEQFPVDIFERPTFENVSTLEFYKFKRIYIKAEELMPEFKQKLNIIIQKGSIK
ncbi:MAG: patatin-like phospholipase family protein [Eubacteriales bacterium]|nr:patatin-like phospholipase family protein [Eubacteriales bacterium]